MTHSENGSSRDYMTRCKHELLPDQCADCLGMLTPEEEEARELHDVELLAERLKNNDSN